MRRLGLITCVLAGLAFPLTAAAQDQEQAINELASQLKQMRQELQSLRQENQRLQAVVAQQSQEPQSDPQSAPQLFPQQAAPFNWTRVPANGAPPSWIDIVVEQNRQRTLESLMRSRAGERVADERLARISAESRAVGAAYCPRPLREVALAGGDVKAFRDQMVSARSSDFDALFNRVQVKEYLKVRAARLVSQASTTLNSESEMGRIAPARIYTLVDQMRTNLDDATILYGPAGLNGRAPAGLAMADEMTRRMRDSSNPQVSGPTRDTLIHGRRAAAVEEAVATDTDIELVQRMHQVREANRKMANSESASVADIADELEHIHGVLSGRVSRTRIPEVHVFEGIAPTKN